MAPDDADLPERKRRAASWSPHTRLAPETFRAVIEEFVTRETTDYGVCEKALDEKVADVMRQLERGEAKIVFEAEEQRVHIVPGRR